jgi:hypothetical protein
MGSLSSNLYVTGAPVPTCASNAEVVRRVCVVTVTVASGKLTDGDILKFCTIPAGHKVVGLALSCGDLDAATALVFDVGLLTHADHTALDTVFISGSTLGQAGGTLAMPATTTMYTTDAASTNKVLALEVKTDAGTIHEAERLFIAIVDYVAT